MLHSSSLPNVGLLRSVWCSTLCFLCACKCIGNTHFCKQYACMIVYLDLFCFCFPMIHHEAGLAGGCFDRPKGGPLSASTSALSHKQQLNLSSSTVAGISLRPRPASGESVSVAQIYFLMLLFCSPVNRVAVCRWFSACRFSGLLSAWLLSLPSPISAACPPLSFRIC